MRRETAVFVEDLTPFLHMYRCGFSEYLVIYKTDYPNENQILFHVCRGDTKANVSLPDICN